MNNVDEHFVSFGFKDELPRVETVESWLSKLEATVLNELTIFAHDPSMLYVTDEN